MLLMTFSDLDKAEIAAVRWGEAQFGLAQAEDLLFFLWRFDSEDGNPVLPWSDNSYSWWRIPEDRRINPHPFKTDSSRLILHIILASAPEGIVRVLRSISLSPQFSRTLSAAIARDIERGSEIDDYDFRLSRVYRSCSSSEILLNRHQIAYCRGGE